MVLYKVSAGSASVAAEISIESKVEVDELSK